MFGMDRSGMQILEAIRSRRSIGKVTDQQPTRAQIEAILDAATWAPNHHLTAPWRFVVIAGEERERFGKVTAGSKLKRLIAEGRPIEGEEEALIAKALRAPVIIAVGVEPSEGPKVVEIEEIEAGAAAVQNMLLAAHALGLGAQWRTGDPAFDPAVATYLGLSERGRIIGFVYVGYPAVEKQRAKHVPFDQVTTWRGWVDEAAD
jgi:nitroreductase